MHTIRKIFPPLFLLICFLNLTITGCNHSSETNLPVQIPTPIALTETPILSPAGNCKPINTATDFDMILLTFPDGAMLYLDKQTEVEYIPSGYCTGIERDQIVLKEGRVAFQVSPSSQEIISVITPRGFIASVEENGLASYNPATGVFKLFCTNRSCALGADLQHMNSLSCGQSASIDAYTSYTGPVPIDPATLMAFGSWFGSSCIRVVTATPSLTPLPLPPGAVGPPDLAATATASCEDFHAQFPLTPCPTVKP